MKILILGDALSSHVQKWVRYFANRGHDVHLISFQPGEIENVCVHHIRSYGSIKISPVASYYSKFGYLLWLATIRRCIHAIHPDILHAHWATSYGLAGAYSGFHPFILSTWGNDIIESPRHSWVLKKIVEYNLGKADIITATSKMLAEETARYEYEGKPIHHVPFGVDTHLFFPGRDSKHSGPICIGTVKAHEEKYGIGFLIRAFAKVKLSGYNVRLLIVGGGSLYERHVKLVSNLGISKYVLFVGKIPNEKVVNHLRQIDIFVVPSISESETFGVAAIEASACALPVIASRIGGLPEVVNEGRTGFLVPPGDTEALSERIIYLLQNPKLRLLLGEEGRKFVQSKYEWERCGADMERIYRNIIYSFNQKYQ